MNLLYIDLWRTMHNVFMMILAGTRNCTKVTVFRVTHCHSFTLSPNPRNSVDLGCYQFRARKKKRLIQPNYYLFIIVINPIFFNWSSHCPKINVRWLELCYISIFLAGNAWFGRKWTWPTATNERRACASPATTARGRLI